MIYTDLEIENDTLIRTFDESIDPIELKWHRDDEDRTVVATEPSDWLIHLYNRVPLDLETPVFI